VGDHVGGCDHRRQAIGILGVVALDRDRDPLRQVPAPGEHATDQRVVDAELLAFVAQPLLGGAGGGVEVDLVAGVQAGDHEAADVVQQRRHRQLVAFDPADHAADLIGRALGGEGVDAEALRLQLPAAVGLEEVEAGRGAGDRQHARRLEDLDRLRDAADAAGDDAAAIGEPEHGDREGDVGLDRFDQVADPRGIGGRRGDHPLAGLDQDREALHRLEGLGEAATRRGGVTRAVGPRGGLLRSDFAGGLGGRGAHWPPHRQLKTFGLAKSTSARVAADRLSVHFPARKALHRCFKPFQGRLTPQRRQ
jgi:hypothetical protein